MTTEYTNIKEKGVWRRVKKSEMRDGASALDTKWVFQIKGDGRYRARLVVKGYTQIPGVDFTESHSPVANDVTIRLLLVYAIQQAWVVEQIDVETAFLYGELKEKIYLRKPKGYNELSGDELSDDDALLLNKTLYGLVQAARVWLKTLINYLVDECNFVQSRAEPCLLLQFENGVLVIAIIIYVDDCVVVGKADDVKGAISMIRKRFNIKVLGELREYVGAEFERKEGKFLIGQEKLIMGMKDRFAVRKKDWVTPAAPGKVLLEGTEGERLGVMETQEYRSGVGKLLYLVKLSRPDLASSVRELAKFMDGSTLDHYQAMRRVMEYAVSTADERLILAPNMMDEGVLTGYTDSNYASDKGSRKSVSGVAIYFCGGLVSWQLKAQQCTTLSSTEAEYVACSQGATEMEFVRQILESMGVRVKLPMLLNVDNTGAINLANNWSTTGKTKHIDVRFHYLQELVDQGMIKLNFVRLEENVADIFTKNLSASLFDEHSKRLGISRRNKEGVKRYQA